MLNILNEANIQTYNKELCQKKKIIKFFIADNIFNTLSSIKIDQIPFLRPEGT